MKVWILIVILLLCVPCVWAQELVITETDEADFVYGDFHNTYAEGGDIALLQDLSGFYG